MRTFVLLVAAAVLALVFPGRALAQQPPQPTPQPPPAQVQPEPTPPQAPPGPRRIQAGRALAGVEVGGRLETVLTRFGRPSEIRETALDTVYVFNRFGINVYARGATITAASGTNSLLKIDDTLGVGYRAEDVLAMFGRGFREGTVEGFPGLIYDSRGIAFGLDGRGVAAILVFRPGTAASVSGLQPGGAALVQPPIGGFPNVAALRPFTAETNFMSLPGYLRWVMHQQTGTWITYAEAERIVAQQTR